jgi:hypothetical protein
VVKEERIILHAVKIRDVYLIDQNFCRSGLLYHVMEGKLEGRIEVTGRRGIRSKQLHDDHREKGGH